MTVRAGRAQRGSGRLLGADAATRDDVWWSGLPPGAYRVSLRVVSGGTEGAFTFEVAS